METGGGGEGGGDSIHIAKAFTQVQAARDTCSTQDEQLFVSVACCVKILQLV